MIDLHCHLLPGVDDGAVDESVAVGIARHLRAAGFTRVAASPHYGEGAGGDVPIERAASTRAALATALGKQGIALELLPNAEHHLTAELLARIERGAFTPIGGQGCWMLLELPWGGIPQLESWIFRVQAAGLKVLLAHPERYQYLEQDVLERLVQRGVRTQLELGSFVGVYGGRAERRAKAYVKAGLAHVVASDLHRDKDAEAWLAKALDRLRKSYGDAAARRALEINPAAVLADSSVDTIAPLEIGK